MHCEEKRLIKYRLIFCDIDDTLLNDELQVSEVDTRAIKDYIHSGGKLVLVTGRNFRSAQKVYNELNINTLIVINAGVVYDPIQKIVLHENSFEQNLLVDLCSFLEQQSVYFQLFHKEIVYVKEKTFYSYQYIERCSVDIKETNIDLSLFIMQEQLPFQKLMIECDESIVDELIVDLRKRFGAFYAISKSKSWIIEISPLNATKGDAVRYILDKYHTGKEESMAIGDSQNDIPMFDCVGLAVAVSNSSKEVLEKANVITKSNNESGVGYAIENYAYSSEA